MDPSPLLGGQDVAPHHNSYAAREGDDDDQNVWDELNDQYHREIEQHNERVRGTLRQQPQQQQQQQQQQKERQVHPPSSAGAEEGRPTRGIVRRLQQTVASENELYSPSNYRAPPISAFTHRTVENGDINCDESDNNDPGGGGGGFFVAAAAAPTTVPLRRVAHQSAQEWNRFVSIFYNAAVTSVREQMEKRRQRQEQRQRRQQQQQDHDSYLDEFGIPREELLEEGGGAGGGQITRSSSNGSSHGGYTSLLEEHHRLQLLQQQQDEQRRRQLQGREHVSDNENNNNNNNSPQPPRTVENDFVFLPPLRFRSDKNNDWGAVADLDYFFHSLYNYYYCRGITRIIVKGTVELVTLFFTLVLSILLFAYIDWQKLATCTDESSCHSDFIQNYIIHAPFSSAHRQDRTVWTGLVVLYCLLFVLYSCFALWSFGHTVQQAYAAKWIYENKLGISLRKLEGGAIDWDRDVVLKLMSLQRSGEYRIWINNNNINNNASSNTTNGANATNANRDNNPFDALMIAQRILRKENFLIALFNRNVIDLRIPFLSHQPFFCSSLEWSLFFCILNFMFNPKYQLRPAFYLDPQALSRRFLVCGTMHLIFMPFLLFFVTLHFGLQNVYDWKSTKQYLGPREWSLHAKWMFREFNELQHNFERRLAPSYESAAIYLGLFGPNEVIAGIGRVLVFIGSSLGAVLFAFAAMNDAILLHVKIADWNLLWYAGVVGAVYSAGKAMIPNTPPPLMAGVPQQQRIQQPQHVYHRSTRNIFAEMDAALEEVAESTHHFPDIWKGRGWDTQTHKAVSSMFQFKAQLFAWELLSIIVAPYILCVSLPKSAGKICEFILSLRAEIPGVGDVCGFSTFDFDQFNDETWGGGRQQQRRRRGTTPGIANTRSEDEEDRTGGADPLPNENHGNEDNDHDDGGRGSGTLSESIMLLRSVHEATRRFPKPKARFEKMKKSYISFKEAHPGWIDMTSSDSNQQRAAGGGVGTPLAAGKATSKRTDALLNIEQELHKEAAARQLETLVQLEEKGHMPRDCTSQSPH